MVLLRNRGKFDLRRLFIMSARNPKAVGFALVDGGQQPFDQHDVEDRTPADCRPGLARRGLRQVRQALLDAGLFAAEADSLLKIWQKRLLEAEGVTVFHLLPVAEYDRLLPLSILPAPATRPVRRHRSAPARGD